jgi:D-beta-D-heptose 7-phosphate kinase/D-beta-D-heptose 1-phosphate adenosyltransferase
MTPERIDTLLERIDGLRVLVAGDVMLDEFVWGNVSRISPEAPVPVVEVTGESSYAGGAANVARNLRQFTPAVRVMGLVGQDDAGRRLAGLLEAAGMNDEDLLADPERRTIVKTRVVARHQQVVRIDREQSLAPSAGQRAELIARLEREAGSLDALILSDYAKGFLDPSFAAAACRLAGTGRLTVTVDPSPRSPLDWRGATAVKPNWAEACAAAGFHHLAGTEEDRLSVGQKLAAGSGAAMVLMTLGEHGMMLFRAGHPPYHTPTRAREVFDVSGAGDTAIALFTLGLAGGATPEEAAELANAASGVVVGKLGTATLSPAELRAALLLP